ncbi:SAF domain-containing protein [Brevibacterium mcbrellneri]|nr:SAF domain-containing protein [Brevibacterium mcbrellneri]
MNTWLKRLTGSTEKKSPNAPPRRLTHTQRRLLAAVCAGLATVTLVMVLLPRSHGDRIVVAHTRIDPGTVITARLVTTRVFPPQLIPENAVTDPAQVVGTTSASSLDAGTPVTTTALLESAPANIPPGHVRVPISVSDPATTSVLRPGHRIQVYSSTSEEANSLVDDALVVSVTTANDQFTGQTSVVTIAVSQEDAPKLAGNAGLSFGLLGETETQNTS